MGIYPIPRSDKVLVRRTEGDQIFDLSTREIEDLHKLLELPGKKVRALIPQGPELWSVTGRVNDAWELRGYDVVQRKTRTFKVHGINSDFSVRSMTHPRAGTFYVAAQDSRDPRKVILYQLSDSSGAVTASWSNEVSGTTLYPIEDLGGGRVRLAVATSWGTATRVVDFSSSPVRSYEAESFSMEHEVDWLNGGRRVLLRRLGQKTLLASYNLGFEVGNRALRHTIFTFPWLCRHSPQESR